MMTSSSILRTTPVTISPILGAKSLRIFSCSASRTFWKMTCLAAWAAMRPRVSAGRSTSTVSPSLTSGRIEPGLRSREISSAGFLGFSAARLTAKTRSSPFSGLNTTWTFSFWEKNLADATLRDSSIAWMMMRGSTPRSLLSCKIVFQTLTFIRCS